MFAQAFLHGGLPVHGQPHGRGLIDHGLKQPQHGRLRDREAVLQVDRAEDCLDGVREDGVLILPVGLHLAAAEKDVLPQPEVAGQSRERIHIHNSRAHLGDIGLAALRELCVQLLGDRQSEHGIAEELEALVVRHVVILVREGTVRQSQPQHLVGELDPPCLQQRGVVVLGICGAKCRLAGEPTLASHRHPHPGET